MFRHTMQPADVQSLPRTAKETVVIEIGARLFLFITLVFAGGSAQAVLVTWTLHNVTFSDGGTASGFVTFDPSVGEDLNPLNRSYLTNFDITTTAGSVFPQTFEYTPAN